LKLIDETKSSFPSISLMDALGIVYPQYWVQGDCEQSFRKHLMILQEFYYKLKYVGIGTKRLLVPPLLNWYRLEAK
jgi:hypothetical protein